MARTEIAVLSSSSSSRRNHKRRTKKVAKDREKEKKRQEARRLGASSPFFFAVSACRASRHALAFACGVVRSSAAVASHRSPWPLRARFDENHAWLHKREPKTWPPSRVRTRQPLRLALKTPEFISTSPRTTSAASPRGVQACRGRPRPVRATLVSRAGRHPTENGRRAWRRAGPGAPESVAAPRAARVAWALSSTRSRPRLSGRSVKSLHIASAGPPSSRSDRARPEDWFAARDAVVSTSWRRHARRGVRGY